MVALAVLVGGPVSGASLNPARSIGPALVSGDVYALWVYLAGRVVGAIVGTSLYGYLREPARERAAPT